MNRNLSQQWTRTRVWAVVLATMALAIAPGCQTTKVKPKEPDPAALAPASKPPPRMESEFAQPATPRTTTETPPFAEPPRTSLIPKDSKAAAEGIPGGDKTYSFSARGLELKDALVLFAKTFDLNILPDPDVTGLVTVDFKNLSLDKSMDALLEVFGYYAEYDRGLIRVKSVMSESFTLDYLRMTRGGTGSSSANISSGSSSGGGSGGGSSAVPGSSGSSGSPGGGDGAGISINQTDTVKFWEELDEQMKSLISTKGKYVINKTAGQVFVTDQKATLDRIRRYLSGVRKTLHRQVDIEARIFEVVLNDEYHLGVDWQNVMGKVGDYYVNSGGGATLIHSSRNIVDSPIGGNTPGAPALSLAMGRKEARAVVDALKEMGTLRIVSQPRIRTLNNQAAMIKVGLDRPFFRKVTDTVAAGGSAAVQSFTIQVQIVTIGTILSITPQISEDGFITMDVSPIITRLVATAKSTDGSTTAPEVDIKQTSSLVRIKTGGTVVI
ncbi:MAG: secretin N-terminal domain-containing protein, partial [Verrucomicrobia bacterium]|nr:secretin N-terminal domain-containing protein [Verrucomicrobiota bacterium]